MPIRLLPAQLANQIAAGEVVERPASVVKELVENSLDAGATQIWIDIEQGGARRIRIRDNGSGIEKDELTLALSRHATSKIATLDDLEAILSLGFRGEALASISSVSRLRLASKPASQAEGWQAWCEGRDMAVQLAPTAHPQGTTVDVQDLFFNTPARRKFLRTEKTEFGHIDEVVRRIALARPAVEIQLSHNQQPLRHYRPVAVNDSARPSDQEQQPPSDEQQAAWARRLEQIVGKRFSQEAGFLLNQQATDELTLFGWLAPPQACRHQGDIQYMYVNGRMMKDKLLSHAIRQAYEGQLADDRQPTYVLYLQLPAQQVDVNVHPAKHEVRFHQARQVHDFVLSSLREALGQLQGTPAVNQDPVRHHYQQAQRTQAEAQATSDYWTMAGGILPGARGLGSGNASDDEGAVGRGVSAKAAQEPTLQSYQVAGAGHESHSSTRGTDGDQTGWQPLQLLNHRYLLLSCVSTSQVALFDVLRAHQYLRTQQLDGQLEQGLSGQPLLLPVQLQIDKAILTEARVLQRLGISYETQRSGAKSSTDQQCIRLTQVPASLRQANLAAVIPELLHLLSTGSATLESMSEVERLRTLNIAQWLVAHEANIQFDRKRAEQIWQQIVNSEPHVEPWLHVLDWQESLRSKSKSS
ncbi:MAG: DNA mismatch repair endonuclease MutL [Gammaproteobacteria bacterium]|nr:DNA mismatch repair endonuclease MutL [Gammaproteobacteria bacterium]